MQVAIDCVCVYVLCLVKGRDRSVGRRSILMKVKREMENQKSMNKMNKIIREIMLLPCCAEPPHSSEDTDFSFVLYDIFSTQTGRRRQVQFSVSVTLALFSHSTTTCLAQFEKVHRHKKCTMQAVMQLMKTATLNWTQPLFTVCRVNLCCDHSETFVWLLLLYLL